MNYSLTLARRAQPPSSSESRPRLSCGQRRRGRDRWDGPKRSPCGCAAGSSSEGASDEGGPPSSPPLSAGCSAPRRDGKYTRHRHRANRRRRDRWTGCVGVQPHAAEAVLTVRTTRPVGTGHCRVGVVAPGRERLLGVAAVVGINGLPRVAEPEEVLMSRAPPLPYAAAMGFVREDVGRREWGAGATP